MQKLLETKLDDSFYTKPFDIYFESQTMFALFDKVVMNVPSGRFNIKHTGTITWKTLTTVDGNYQYRATFGEPL